MADELTDQPEPRSAGGLQGEVIQVLSRYGLGALISLGLIYWLATSVQARMDTMRDQLENHVRVSSFFSRQICINTARDEAQARSCEPPIMVDRK